VTQQQAGSVLFAVNYPSGTGYAWATIEAVFRGLVDSLERDGFGSLVCYPSLAGGRPAAFEGSAAEVIELDCGRAIKTGHGMQEVLGLIRSRRVRLLYLTDHPTRHPRYLRCHAAGVRHIVVHDRTSGARSRRAAPVRWMKRALHAIPWYAADRFLGVSDFVTERLREVSGTPPRRTFRVYNGIDVSRFDASAEGSLATQLGLPADARVVFASGRAAPYKGIGVFIEAAHRLAIPGNTDVHFAYAGDGPALQEFRDLASRLDVPRFHFLGRRSDVAPLLGSATVAVIPSVWAEAFGLTVVEAMAAGRPLVASRIGGIPELVEQDRTGLLVEPGNADELARAIQRLLDDPVRAAEMGARAKAVARERFSIGRAVAELSAIVLPLLRS
jgi:glycosyltransferase involved in cell wall biosynthesis